MVRPEHGSLDRAAWQLIEAFSQYDGAPTPRLAILLQQCRLLIQARLFAARAVRAVRQ